MPEPLPDDREILFWILQGCEDWLSVAVPRLVAFYAPDLDEEAEEAAHEAMVAIPFPGRCVPFLEFPWTDHADAVVWIEGHFVRQRKGVWTATVQACKQLHSEAMRKLTAAPPEHAMQQACYEWWEAGWLSKQIAAAVAKHPDWPQLNPKNRHGAKRAAEAHAKRRGLPMPKPRREGPSVTGCDKL